MTLNSTSMAQPSYAAIKLTAGHAQADRVKHQLKPPWARSTGVGQPSPARPE